jgi:hypothetical protein
VLRDDGKGAAILDAFSGKLAMALGSETNLVGIPIAEAQFLYF